MHHVDGVREAVERHWQILFLHSFNESIQQCQIVLGVDESLASLMEVSDCEARKRQALGFRQSQRIEAPGLQHILRHTEILYTDCGGGQLLFTQCHRLRHSGLELLLLHNVCAGHHAENADILVVHALGRRRHVLGSLKVGNNRKLLHHLLQQLHLVGAINVGNLLFIPGVHFCAELEDCGSNLSDRVQHALERPHRKLRHHTRQGETAEDHYNDDEDDRRNRETRLELIVRVHVEPHHESVGVHHQC
mmetsp:Transcript_39127/g.83346  ORF Transcript_39127/g.83346 Transcript_39127/m.83346 type:complete len:248 (+) Transcript_39127:1111-1854(+)